MIRLENGGSDCSIGASSRVNSVISAYTPAALLEYNPFPDKLPCYDKINAWQYNFTNFEEREKTGNWWKRTAPGSVTPFPRLERREPAEDD